MKLNCGPDAHERRAREYEPLTNWHPWFAWRPVRVDRRQCVWLETVQRKGQLHACWDKLFWTWEYRPNTS